LVYDAVKSNMGKLALTPTSVKSNHPGGTVEKDQVEGGSREDPMASKQAQPDAQREGQCK